MRKYTLNAIVLLLFTSLIMSCGDGGTTDGSGTTDSGSTDSASKEVKFNQKEEGKFETKRKKNIEKIFYGLPSIVEMAELIKSSGASFNQEFLNDPTKADSYLTASSKAINLGIYGADLSYTMMFEQDKQNISYFNAVHALAKNLDVEAALESGVIERIKDNKEDQDSLMTILTETYWTINAFLKENQAQEEISALVIAGGWMEGLHLAGKHYTPGNTKIRERIAEQKYALKNLCDLMDTYETAALDAFKSDLGELQKLYEKVEITKGKTTKDKDKSGMVVLGGERKVSMDDVTLNAVLSKIEEIRNKYIK